LKFVSHIVVYFQLLLIYPVQRYKNFQIYARKKLKINRKIARLSDFSLSIFLKHSAFGLQRLPLLGSYFFKQPDIVKRATEGRQHKGLHR
jgi:hypothetical protein